MTMNLDFYKDLGLAKNEAQIYETLLQEGESSVGQISNKSKVHRRNVYDSLKRLLEKGLVFEILQKHENHYQAVDPHKLVEILEEKQKALSSIMPKLLSLYQNKARREEAFIYRGLEAYKNEMRDIIRIGQDMFTIGGKGVWADPKLKSFFESWVAEANQKKIKFYVLWDHTVGEKHRVVSDNIIKEYKFLPPAYSTKSIIDIFGDRVVISSTGTVAALDENIVLTVIINQQVADAFVTWFKLIWDLCPDPPKST